MSGNPFVSHPDFEQPQMPNPLVGQPPVGLVPAPEAEAPPSPPPAPESQPPPAPTPESIAASKYGDDLSKTRKGYDEMFMEVQRTLIPELQAQREQNRLLMERVMAMSQPQPSATPEPELDELAALGIPVQALERLIEKRADKRVEARLAPIDRFARAQTEILKEIPNYAEVAPHIARFLSTHPELEREVNEMAQINPKAATKYAYREFEAQRPRASAADEGLNKTNAAIPTSNSVGNRMAGERDFQSELQRAQDHYMQTGDDRPYWKIWNEMRGAPMHPDTQGL